MLLIILIKVVFHFKCIITVIYCVNYVEIQIDRDIDRYAYMLFQWEFSTNGMFFSDVC